MPQIEKGGKYVFGWSWIHSDGAIRIPPEALAEYHIAPGEQVILISGSLSTGGFSVTTHERLMGSQLASILLANPDLAEARLEEGHTVRYKGRLHAWVRLGQDGVLHLSAATLTAYGIPPGIRLLVIRGSGLAFVMGARGPIVDVANRHPEIPEF